MLREQLDRAYDALRLKRTEERDMVQDVAQVGGQNRLACDIAAPHTGPWFKAVALVQ